MSANPIWIAGYFGPVAGASPVWIAPGDGTVSSAVQSEIVSYYAPVAGATAVWIAGFFAPPPAAIGATPITISGWGGSGGGGPPPPTSVWSSSDAAASSMTLSNGGLTAALTAAKSIRGTISKTSGKVYVEFLANATSGADYIYWGLASAGFIPTAIAGTSNYSGAVAWNANPVSAGFTSNYNITPVPVNNDVMALAIDFATGATWIALNNVWQNSSNPATGTLPILTFVPATVGALFPLVSTSGTGEVWTLQSTAASQKYAPPSGFKAWDAP